MNKQSGYELKKPKGGSMSERELLIAQSLMLLSCSKILDKSPLSFYYNIGDQTWENRK